MSKPFLKWAGGKHKLVPFIASHLSPLRRRLIEPFAGSAALSLALEFESYLLNDANPDLIGLFQILKNEKQAFIDYAHQYFSAEHNQEKRFYALREQFNNSEAPIERAALFVYLNRHAFNGLCRYNSKGQFNVPFGRYRAPYFPEKEMQAFTQKAERMEIQCSDFQTALQQVNSDDTIYCDPPYVPLSTTASFTAYSKDSFNLEEQSRLATVAQQIASQSQGVLISNHDTGLTRELYCNARLETISVQRNIAANGSSRQKVGELLAIYDA
jgi:DNA adenine methylase